MKKLNTDINVLGSLPDWNIIINFYKSSKTDNSNLHTSIKTEKSIKRFKKAIESTFLTFPITDMESLFKSLIYNEGISDDSLLFIFWNASFNNDLLQYLNKNVFFPAFYSGRISLMYNEVIACIYELINKINIEKQLITWSDSTIKTTASKYLTLLKKFRLLEGRQTKNILHPFLDKKMFVIFVYWLVAVSGKSNILNSLWLPYGFMEQNIFIDRLKKKQFVDYFDIYFTGDNLKIEPKIKYKDIYDIVTRN